MHHGFLLVMSFTKDVNDNEIGSERIATVCVSLLSWYRLGILNIFMPGGESTVWLCGFRFISLQAPLPVCC